jgi:hypothetical protein
VLSQTHRSALRGGKNALVGNYSSSGKKEDRHESSSSWTRAGHVAGSFGVCAATGRHDGGRVRAGTFRRGDAGSDAITRTDRMEDRGRA